MNPTITNDDALQEQGVVEALQGKTLSAKNITAHLNKQDRIFSAISQPDGLNRYPLEGV